MPLYNWDQCQNGNLRFMNFDAVSTCLDFERFEDLQDQYIDRYDLREDMIIYLKIKIALTKLRLLYIETGEKMYINQINIETINLAKADPKGFKGMTIDESLAWLRTQMPSWIDKKIITVTEFRDLMDEYGRRNKKK